MSIETLVSEISNKARAEAEGLIAETESENARVLDESKARARQQADQILRNSKLEAEAIRRKYLSDAKQKVRLEELAIKNRIIQETVEEARSRLSRISESAEEYEKVLNTIVSQAIRQLGSTNVRVLLNEKELKRLTASRLTKSVEKILDTTVSIEWGALPRETLGGAVVETADRRQRIIDTFDARLKNAELQILSEAGKLLFP